MISEKFSVRGGVWFRRWDCVCALPSPQAIPPLTEMIWEVT